METGNIKSKNFKTMDEGRSIHNLLVGIVQNPQKVVNQGDIFLTVLKAVADTFDINRNDLTDALISEEFAKFESKNKKAQQKFKKSNSRKLEKFQAYKVDENNDYIYDSKNNKIPLKPLVNKSGEFKVRTYWQKNYKTYLKDKDKTNEKYFKDGTFNYLTYITVKWKSINKPDNKIYMKLLNQMKEENDKILKEIERQKKLSGFIEKPKKTSAWIEFVKEKSEEYKDDAEFSKLHPTKRIKFLSPMWKGMSAKAKRKYDKKANKINEDNVEKTKVWKEYIDKCNKAINKEKNKQEKESQQLDNNQNNDNNNSDSNSDSDSESDSENSTDNVNNSNADNSNTDNSDNDNSNADNSDDDNSDDNNSDDDNTDDDNSDAEEDTNESIVNIINNSNNSDNEDSGDDDDDDSGDESD